MNDSKFLGICIVVSAVILAAAILWHAHRPPMIMQPGKNQAVSQIGRYQFQPSNPPGVIWILDTTTGKVKTQGG